MLCIRFAPTLTAYSLSAPTASLYICIPSSLAIAFNAYSVRLFSILLLFATYNWCYTYQIPIIPTQ